MKKSSILVILLAGSLAMPTVSHAAKQSGKRVEIDKSDQQLRAYEDGELVFESRISTGKEGKRTPSGTYSAKGKERMHRSRLYDNAPMPYSVHIGGNYYIHGFKSVPDHPASHGCIRLPVAAAKEFYDWVTPGTPVRIHGSH